MVRLRGLVVVPNRDLAVQVSKPAQTLSLYVCFAVWALIHGIQCNPITSTDQTCVRIYVCTYLCVSMCVCFVTCFR